MAGPAPAVEELEDWMVPPVVSGSEPEVEDGPGVFAAVSSGFPSGLSRIRK